jgi:hypothetical protein
MSNAFTALIWWLIPLAGLLGALGYVASFKANLSKKQLAQ